MSQFIYTFLGTLSCGGATLFPDCSYCDAKNNGTAKCDGNCRVNPNTNICERAGTNHETDTHNPKIKS